MSTFHVLVACDRLDASPDVMKIDWLSDLRCIYLHEAHAQGDVLQLSP